MTTEPGRSPAMGNPSAPPTPVLMGADIGVYSLARSFHEAWGVRATTVAGAALGPVRDSAILDVEVLDDGHDGEEAVERLLALAERPSNGPRILMPNSDWHVGVVIAHRAVLEPHFVIPYASAAAVAEVSEKASFDRLCAEAGVRTPLTVVASAEDDLSSIEGLGELSYPLIAKPSSTAEYHQAEFAGKKKVFVLDGPEDLAALWATLREAGYLAPVVIQEFVPGDDTCSRVVTVYVDTHGVMTVACVSQVLLEEHAPTALGNVAAATAVDEPALVESVRTLLARADYRGFATVDVKVHPRTGEAFFLEINPRIGRNNYMVNVAGVNPLEAMVADVVRGERRDPVVATGTDVYSLVPGALLRRYLLEPSVRRRIGGNDRRNPLFYGADRGAKRVYYVLAAYANQWRKFARDFDVDALRATREAAGQ